MVKLVACCKENLKTFIVINERARYTLMPGAFCGDPQWQRGITLFLLYVTFQSC